MLGADALDAEGNLAERYRDTKVGKEYLAARERAKSSKSFEALQASIYNHLYAFFSRYYQDGDFIFKRRYSKKERYAIPYNGEEVYIYWANHDQYYVKTGEYFTDYTWKAPKGVTVHFKLKAADVEQNNVKGEKRFFLPRLDELAWDEQADQLTVPFEFRPLTEQESIAYGQKNQQEAIIAKAVSEIPEKLGKHPRTLAALSAEKRKTDKGESVTYLEHHLRQYTARNMRDFFIHKDLSGFLSRELDFYLKNEVLNLGGAGSRRRKPCRRLVSTAEPHQEGRRAHHRVLGADRRLSEDALGEEKVRHRDLLLHHRRQYPGSLLPGDCRLRGAVGGVEEAVCDS